MATKAQLENEISGILQSQWTTGETIQVPAPEDLRLNNNHAKLLKNAVVLYADLDGSTNMVDNFSWYFSAEIYKCYLRAASQIAKDEGGVITSYDGDRVMVIFIGDSKNTNAVRAALKINSAVIDIIRPAIKLQYPNDDFLLKHVIGIDRSDLHAARIGVRADNDITWVGRAANHAAKLTSLSDKPIWITKDIYDAMNNEAKFSAGINMWQKMIWNPMGKMEIYCSTYKWAIS